MASKLSQYSDEVINAYRSGKSLQEIGERYNVSRNTVKHFLTVIHNERLRPPNRGSSPFLDNFVEQEISDKYKEGVSANRLCELYNLQYSHVVSILKRHAVKTRRRTQSPDLRIPVNGAVLGYLAGMIDGEGTIRQFTSQGRDRVLIQIANTDKQLMDWLVANIGGQVYWADVDEQKRRLKPLATWKVYKAVDCYYLLKAVEPFLIIKRHLAQAAIAFLQDKWGLN